MAFIPATDCASIVIDGVIGTKPIANVLNAHFAGGYTQSNLDSLSSIVDAWVGAHYIPLIGAACDYVQTRVRGLTSIIDLQSTDGTSAGPGTATGATLPANVTCCITARTGFTGRSARGRFYAFPNTQSALATLQTWNATYPAALATALNLLTFDVNAIGAVLVVLSRQSLGVPRVAAVPTPITTWNVTNVKIDSQRNRLLAGH
jgi:hypothetical protein